MDAFLHLVLEGWKAEMPCENANPHAFEFGKPAQAGEIVAVAAACLVGSETRGVWTCQRPLTQTDLHFAFFQQLQINHAHINIESSQRQDSSPTKSTVIAL
jgi:hypothetical protein